MKKGQIVDCTVREIQFPNKGLAIAEGEEKPVIVKNTVAGQKVRARINKIRKGKAEGQLLEVLEKSPLEIEPQCPHFCDCGGCTYQNLPYEQQLQMKAAQVKKLLDEVCSDYEFEGIKGSPETAGYRNKMEFSFGDAEKDGPLALGLHKRGSFYDIVTVDHCRIVEEDFRRILMCVLEHFASSGTDFYHKRAHKGYLRHLLVRKAKKTGEILVDLVTTSQTENVFGDAGQALAQEACEKAGQTLEQGMCGKDEQELVQETCENAGQILEQGTESVGSFPERTQRSEQELLTEMTEKLLALQLDGKISGILHTVNDSLADVIQNDRTEILYGQNYFYEELLGLRFRITPFSFFQTNSLAAEVLYELARSYVGDTRDRTIFDLYSGTGTIAQILAPVAKKVVGVEIVEEAVEAARENAAANGLKNCEFLAGDVLKVIDTVPEKPDIIVLDPPRDGIHPKALAKIIAYNVDTIVYISCKPTSLARDLVMLQEGGYRVEKVVCADLFPGTVHVETVCLLHKV